MAISKVVVVDGNNLTVRIDRGVAGRSVTDVQPIEIDNALYLEFFFSDGTTETVGPVGTIQYIGESPIVVEASTISLSTVPVNLGGTGQVTANAGFNALAPSQTSNAGKYLKTDGTNAAWDLLDISTADITGVLPIANGGTNAATAADARTNLNAANQDTTISAGTGLSGGGSLADNRTISIANTTVTAASYGDASKTLTATVNAQGQLTALADTPIAIANTQISGLGTMSTQDANAVAITGGSITGITDLAVVDGGTGASTAAGARTNLNAADQDTTITAGTGLSGGGSLAANRTLSIANTAVTAASYGSASDTLTATVNAQGQLTALAATPIAISNTQISGLGTMSTQNSNAVTITGGSITGITDLAIVDGGTGASTAADARSNLGLGTAAVLNAGVANGVATLDAGGTVPLSQIPASIQGGVSYQGAWNASTNTPTLTSSVGAKGHYYVVSVSGNTNLNGVTDWLVGDWAIYNGSAWEKIDNTDAVASVNGYTGVVVLSNTDVGAPSTSLTISAGTGLTGGGDLTTNRTISIANTAVSAGSYGTASAVPSFTVNGQGQLTAAANTTIAIANTQVSGLGTMSTQNANAVAITGGTATLTSLTVNDNTTLGSSNSDEVNFNARIASEFTPSTANTYDLGRNSHEWRNLYLTGTANISALTASGTVTLNGGTANGVAYLNGSKVLTTGSALTFDGTDVGLGGAPVSVGVAGMPAYAALSTTSGRSGAFYWQDTGANNVAYSYFFGSVFQFGTSTNHPVAFMQSGSEQMRLTSTGLGIGNSSPTAKLDVTGTAAISGAVTLSGGTANCVSYLNGSKVLTSSGNLQFDGNQLYARSGTSAFALKIESGNTTENWIAWASGAATIGSVYRGASDNSVNLTANFGPLIFGIGSAGTPSEQMRLTSTGLGIGTSSPQNKFVVSNAGAAGFEVDPAAISGATYSLFINRSTSAWIDDIRRASTYQWRDSTGTERMRLDSSGNLGLGVTPSSTIWSGDETRLVVKGNGSSKAGVLGLQSQGTTNATTAFFVAEDLRAGASLGTSTNSFLAFQTNGSERARITSGGDVGIGTSSPVLDYRLTTSSSLDATAGIYIENTSTGTSASAVTRFKNSGTTTAYSGLGGVNRASYAGLGANVLAMYTDSTAGIALTVDAAGPITFNTNSTTKATLDSSGNLGLGVTPSAWRSGDRAFDIGGISALADVQSAATRLVSNAYGVSGGVYIYKTNNFASYYNQQSGQHQWYTAPSGTAGDAITFTQAMTLDASGQLLVGKTASSQSVAGCELRPGSAYFAQTGVAIYTNMISGTGDTVQFRQAASPVGSISVTASATAYNTSSDYRLKNITGPITNSGAYIDSLNPVEGTWKADGSTFVGLIAHEVQEASRTNVATGVKDGEEMQGMDYSNAELIANLIAEVKALRTRVAALESI